MGGGERTTKKGDLGTYLMLTVSFAALLRIFILKRILLHDDQGKIVDGSPEAMFGILLCLITRSDTDLADKILIFIYMYIYAPAPGTSLPPLPCCCLYCFSHCFTGFAPSGIFCPFLNKLAYLRSCQTQVVLVLHGLVLGSGGAHRGAFFYQKVLSGPTRRSMNTCELLPKK